MRVVHHRHGGDDGTLLYKHRDARQGSFHGSPLFSGIDCLFIVVVNPSAFGQIDILRTCLLLHHRSYQQLLSEQELAVCRERFHIRRIFQKERTHDGQSRIMSFAGIRIDIRQ